MVKLKYQWNLLKVNLLGRSFLSSIVILAGGTALGQALLLLSSPILTRIYIPEDLGRFSLVTSFLGVATIFITLSYDSAIVAAKNNKEAAMVTILAIFLSTTVSILALIALYAMVEYKILGFDSLPFYILPVIWLGLIVTASFSALRSWLVRVNNFRLISKISITQNTLRALGQVIFGLVHVGWVGLVLGDLLGRGGGVVSMIQQTKNLFRQELGVFDFRDLLETLKLYKRFPTIVLPSSLIDALASTLPIPLVAHYYDSTAAGHLALVQRVIAIPISIIGASVADAFYNRVGIYSRENPHLIEPFFVRTAMSLGLLGCMPAVLLFVYGPVLFHFVFGANWDVAGYLASFMAIWALAQFIVSPLSRVVYVVGSQQLKLVYDSLALIIVLGSFYIGHLLHFSMVETIALLSVLMTAAYGVYFMLLLFAIRHAKKTL